MYKKFLWLTVPLSIAFLFIPKNSWAFSINWDTFVYEIFALALIEKILSSSAGSFVLKLLPSIFIGLIFDFFRRKSKESEKRKPSSNKRSRRNRKRFSFSAYLLSFKLINLLSVLALAVLVFSVIEIFTYDELYGFLFGLDNVDPPRINPTHTQ